MPICKLIPLYFNKSEIVAFRKQKQRLRKEGESLKCIYARNAGLTLHLYLLL